MTCLFDPIGCVQTGVLSALAGVPWWAWAIAILVALIVAYRLLGLPGLAAAALAIGYAFGKTPAIDPIEHLHPNDQDAAPPPKRRNTIF